MDYRLYFIGADGHIQAMRELAAQDDESAMTEAQALFVVDQRFPSGEVWQQTRRLRRLER